MLCSTAFRPGFVHVTGMGRQIAYLGLKIINESHGRNDGKESFLMFLSRNKHHQNISAHAFRRPTQDLCGFLGVQHL